VAGKTVEVPHDVSLLSLIEWNDQLWRSSHVEKVTIDFSRCDFFTPFAMVFIAHQMRLFHGRFPDANIEISSG
jgi:hypothetical protein